MDYLISIGIVLAITVIGLIISFAHYNKRNGYAPRPLPDVKPPEPIEWRTTDIYEDRDKGLRYPIKLSITFANIHKEPIAVSSADWTSHLGGVQLAVHSSDGTGMQFVWQGNEGQRFIIPSQEIFQVWFGINENHSSDFLHMRRRSASMGTVSINGHMIFGGRMFGQKFQI